MGQAFKFLHASDLHLDQVISGLADVPAHLKSLVANAAYQAAENIFNLAIAEKVDFVLLAGDIADFESGGPRASTFLQYQLERLSSRGIGVFWCSGAAERIDRWPGSDSLPENVRTFPSYHFERCPIERDGKTLAVLYGTGHVASRTTLADLKVQAGDSPVIALVYGEFDPAETENAAIRYWALGGSHAARMQSTAAATIVYPGTPQSRQPAETGEHSCALVTVDATGVFQVDAVAVDTVRWLPQTLAFAESATDQEIKNLLTDRGLKLVADCPDQLGLVAWHIETTGEVDPRFRRAHWKQEMLQWLRAEFGSAEKGIWSTAIRLEGQRSLPKQWYDEDTMLGDYLRALADLKREDRAIHLGDWLPAHAQEEHLNDLARIDSESRDEVLQEAALMGVERLGIWIEDE